MPFEFLEGAIKVSLSPIPVPISVARPTPINIDESSSLRLRLPYLISSNKAEVVDSKSIRMPLTLTPCEAFFEVIKAKSSTKGEEAII